MTSEATSEEHLMPIDGSTNSGRRQQHRRKIVSLEKTVTREMSGLD